MNFRFDPFTPETFQEQTGMIASDNEAIYLRWVNTQINYANYRSMMAMNDSLKLILDRLAAGPVFGFSNDGKANAGKDT